MSKPYDRYALMLKDYRGITHLKSMDIEQLKKLSDDVRQEIISCVSKNGGHLASSLGAVELALALHYVFNSPYDRIIWDVGHQAYAHKLITGRDLSLLRKKGGTSGFPKPEESEHDAFIAGHAGVSISEATGVAKMQPDNFAIAVIGDGSMTSGMVYEAMNHAGSMKLKNLIVILNDNDMSISENVGAISAFISKNIINNVYYQKVRSEIKSLIASFPLQKTFNINLMELVKKIRSSAVSLIAPEAFFEAFGFRYIGPFDGHDIEVLVKAFRNIPVGEEDSSPILLHVVTKKGKGYAYAEDDPSLFHGISCFDALTGKSESSAKTLPTFTSVFGDEVCRIAEKNKDVVAITAAMKEGTGLDKFESRFKDRFYDVGIAEQHAVTFAAGLAKTGVKPIVAIYSTFIQRSFDQLIHDAALNGLDIVFCLDRAGVVGEDGATHHGVFDLSFIRCIPGVTIMSPSSSNELRKMLNFAVEGLTGPVFIRYPRGCVPDWDHDECSFNIADMKEFKSRIIFENNHSKDHLTIFAAGYSAYVAMVAAKEFCKEFPGVPIRVYDARFIKPLDNKTILEELSQSFGIITVEENTLCGGFGSAILEVISDSGLKYANPIKRLGINDVFVEHASQCELRESYNIGVQAIKHAIKGVLEKRI